MIKTIGIAAGMALASLTLAVPAQAAGQAVNTLSYAQWSAIHIGERQHHVKKVCDCQPIRAGAGYIGEDGLRTKMISYPAGGPTALVEFHRVDGIWRADGVKVWGPLVGPES